MLCMFLCVDVCCLLKLHGRFVQDDEEWDDYRENKKDYTGLKIENLVVEEPAVKPEEEDTEVTQRNCLKLGDFELIGEKARIGHSRF